MTFDLNNIKKLTPEERAVAQALTDDLHREIEESERQAEREAEGDDSEDDPAFYDEEND